MRILSIFKRFVGVLLLTGILLSLASCIAPVCYHDWVPATCDSPKYCTICSITDGKKLIHSGGVASCTDLAKCDFCGRYYGEYASHKYSNKKISENPDEDKHYYLCTLCGASNSGEAHEWNVDAPTYADDKHCKVCGYVAEEAIAHEHTGGEADCDSGAVCDLCNKEYTEPLGHSFVFDDENPNWEYADSGKHYHKCTVCAAPDDGEEHHWVTEDGDDAVCDACQASYSDFFIVPEE